MPKSTKIEFDKRIFIVQGWIISSVPDYLILKQAVQQWGVTERQAKTYKNRAYKLWREAKNESVDEERQVAIAGMQQDIRSMDEKYKGTPAGMRAVHVIKKEIHKLKGILPAKEHVVSGNPNKPIEIKTSEDREKRIAFLIAKAMKQE